jgi:hypothetical protein
MKYALPAAFSELSQDKHIPAATKHQAFLGIEHERLHPTLP